MTTIPAPHPGAERRGGCTEPAVAMTWVLLSRYNQPLNRLNLTSLTQGC